MSLNRRRFIQTTGFGIAAFSLSGKSRAFNMTENIHSIRLGGPVFDEQIENPYKWVDLHRKLGYSAAFCPLEADATSEQIREFETAAKKANLLIAEVGAWSNPISPDEKIRKEAFDHCCDQLHLADQIGACCCVNIAGSRDPQKWDGPHPDNFSDDTFDLIVEVTRKIIDEVKPTRTYFTLETMPWVFPHSVETYKHLLKAIERKQFAVHFDPVNLINSPERYFHNSKMIRDAFKTLGPYIKSCHAKDTLLRPQLTTHIDEVQPGKGNLNYTVFLKELAKLKDVPLMLEHLESPEEYKNAAAYIRNVGRKNGLNVFEI